MKKCMTCEFLDLYIPTNERYIRKDGTHTCGMAGGKTVDVNSDAEAEDENLQHVCYYIKRKECIQLELNLK